LLIGVHEFGHFITAKLFKMNVIEFAIGMGPAIFKKQGKSTLYSLRIFPLGGYCALEGEDGDSDAEGAFSTKPAWQRAIVLFAGAFMNLVAGLVILFVLFSQSEAYVTREINSFADGFDCAGETMLMPGDEITKINGYSIFINSDISMFLDRDAGAPYDFEVIRDGKRISLDDVPLTRKMYTYVGIDEAGNEKEYTEYKYGINFSVAETRFADKIELAFLNALDFARLVKVSFFDLFKGNAHVNELTGPVGITSLITETAQTSMPNMWFLVALIAVNLAVMNLLPIPALDGGRILFLLIGELVYKITKKPLNSKFESILNTVFFAVLMAFMIYVSFNDIVRLIK